MTTKIINQPNFFLFTGGPGAGKTSVLNELGKSGYAVVPEVAREIIKTQNRDGGNATHTGNRNAFRDLMLEQSVIDFDRRITSTKPFSLIEEFQIYMAILALFVMISPPLYLKRCINIAIIPRFLFFRPGWRYIVMTQRGSKIFKKR